jgi:benzoyl-CoA 2,3-dioxygenase component B
VKRWNKIVDDAGISFQFALPHPGFNRHVGINSGHHITPDGTIVDEQTWQDGQRHWLPSTEDLAFVRSLMHPVYERGKIASWVAPPRQGINGKPFDYEYVYL